MIVCIIGSVVMRVVVCQCVCLVDWLFIYLFACLRVGFFVCLYSYVFVHTCRCLCVFALFVYMFERLYVSLFVCPCVFVS